MFESIVHPEILYENLNHPDWVIIDCRFDLKNPSWGFEEYQKEHIPNAYFADLDKDLSSPKRIGTGRHPLPNLELFAKKCSTWGIERGKQVVVYDDLNGAFAGRLWWMLKYLGHETSAILEGGLTVWKKLDKPVTNKLPRVNQAKFIPRIQEQLLISSEELLKKLGTPELLLIDSRAQIRYDGIEEPLDKVAGHIPGAVNRFHQENLDEQGFFISDKDLLLQFSSYKKGHLSDLEVIVYCGSGVTSCLYLVALNKLGIKQAKLYLGSWSEWIENPSNPIITKK